ncbi:MAG: LD-carboxypeptidase [Crocinitomicaceae bacterium]
MMHVPKPLSKGDHIRILAPAKRIDATDVQLAKKVLEEAQYRVSISEHCLGQQGYFSGTLDQRLSDLQQALNDPSIGAVLCARGGYGCVQLVDRLDWTTFQKHPKWIIGFSDVTVLHGRIQNLGIASIHGTMPLNFKDHTKESRETLINAISGATYSISAPKSTFNQAGKVKGKLIGGNLAILASLLGTNDQLDYSDAILFVEEVGEPLYSIDRMFYSLQKAGVLNKIKGLIVGGMTSMKDSEIPYGKPLEEIILTHTQPLGIPVAFGFPAGHIDDNRALVFGAEAILKVDASGSEIRFEFGTM